jgi:hypothetical protein
MAFGRTADSSPGRTQPISMNGLEPYKGIPLPFLRIDGALQSTLRAHTMTNVNCAQTINISNIDAQVNSIYSYAIL